jgi:hypothetical protein
MNDPNSEWDAFERQLREFRPARPSDELMARLENRPAVRPARNEISFWAGIRFVVFGTGGVTALVVILAGWFVVHNGLFHVSVTTGGVPPAVVSGQTPLVCAGTSEAVVAARDEGIYTDANGQPVQIIRLLDLNKSEWRDTRNGNRMEVVVPRQRLLVKDVETY